MIAVRYPSGATDALEVPSDGKAAEVLLIRELIAKVTAVDPDVIENHNRHCFDLPFLARRA
jgi:DNA polymerase elongation subunit (family B)